MGCTKERYIYIYIHIYIHIERERERKYIYCKTPFHSIAHDRFRRTTKVLEAAFVVLETRQLLHSKQACNSTTATL
jgi:hypothetical protein